MKAPTRVPIRALSAGTPPPAISLAGLKIHRTLQWLELPLGKGQGSTRKRKIIPNPSQPIPTHPIPSPGPSWAWRAPSHPIPSSQSPRTPQSCPYPARRCRNRPPRSRRSRPRLRPAAGGSCAAPRVCGQKGSALGTRGTQGTNPSARDPTWGCVGAAARRRGRAPGR